MFIKSKKPTTVNIKELKKDDCTIVAVGNALNISYDLSRKLFQSFKEKNNDKIIFNKTGMLKLQEMRLMSHVKLVCRSLCKNTLHTRPGGVTVNTFSKENPKGIFLVMCSTHLTLVKDGDIYDTWDCGSSNFVTAYEIDVDSAREKLYSLAKHFKMDNNNHFF